MPFSLPFPLLENRGAARGRRRWPSPAAGRKGKRGREARGVDPRPQLGGRRSEVAWPRRPVGGGGPGPASWRCGSGQGEGEKHEGTKRVLSPTSARLRCSEESCPREPVAAGRGALGGGAAELGRRRAAAEVAVVARGCARGLFIGEARRWGEWGVVEAGELGGRP